MEIYLVGGAVRDERLGFPVRERDWVVVGASPEDMRARGFRQVGREFPVFLHPQTGEEHALARTERKAGRGHTAFSVQAGPEVTLDADLARRDLTINAVARDADGNVTDPYGGCADLEARVLRHVSPAFIEDPLRVLRVARFAARFAAQGFRVAPETRALMTTIAHSGELAELAPERIWQETARALDCPRPSVYFQVLEDCKALESLFPLLAAIAPPEVVAHPAFACLDSAPHAHVVEERFAALVAAAARDQRRMPTASEPDDNARARAEGFADHLGTSRSQRALVGHAAAELGILLLPRRAGAEHLLAGLLRCDAQRRPDRFERLCRVVERLSGALPDGGDVQRLRALWVRLPAALAVDAAPFVERGLKGPEVGEALRHVQLKQVAASLEGLE